jgi:glycerol-3-phosphate responsive antiterminator
MESHLPLAILLRLLDLIFNNNGLVNHVLKVCVIRVEQLELNIIIESIQEHVIFLFINVDIIRGISWLQNE